MTERPRFWRLVRGALVGCAVFGALAARNATAADEAASTLRIVGASSVATEPLTAPLDEAFDEYERIAALAESESREIAAPDVRIARALPRTAPGVPADEILLISARRCGSRCDAATMLDRIECERYVQSASGCGDWQEIAWSDAVRSLNRPLPTIAYVHGNRIDRGVDRSQGLTMYRVLRAKQDADQPLRFVIWSWPSEQIPGLVKDYKVKGARTRPAAWQLAWTVDQIPADTPLSLVGYSYGARVVTGALHLLGGGEMDGLALEPRLHPQREPIRVALLAAALKADWLRPGGYHGRAVTQTADLLLVNNRRDPIMRFFHLTSEGHGVNALGYTGPVGLGHVTTLAGRIKSIDATDAVGRHHALAEYLAAGNRVMAPLQQAARVSLPPRTLVDAGEPSTVAGRTAVEAR